MSKKTVVVGASTKTDRYSNRAIHRLVSYNHPVVAIGAMKGEVAGVPIQKSYEVDDQIDTVTMYIHPLRQPPVYEDIINLKPKRVIFNPGTENPEFFQKLEEAAIEVEIACTLVLLSTDQY